METHFYVIKNKTELNAVHNHYIKLHGFKMDTDVEKALCRLELGLNVYLYVLSSLSKFAYLDYDTVGEQYNLADIMKDIVPEELFEL